MGYEGPVMPKYGKWRSALKWSKRHMDVLRYVAKYPGQSQSQIGAATNYSRQQIGNIMRHPEFDSRLRAMVSVMHNRHIRNATNVDIED